MIQSTGSLVGFADIASIASQHGRCVSIQGFPDYCVCENGTFWSKRKNGQWRQVHGGKRDTGHIRVVMRNGNTKKTDYLHRLVLESFVGPCPDGMEACHFPDHNPSNNSIDNLRWDTSAENSKDRVRQGRSIRGSDVHGAKLSKADAEEVIRLGIQGLKQRDIAAKFGISQVAVKEVLHGRNWRYLERLETYQAKSRRKTEWSPCEVCGEPNGRPLRNSHVPARVSLSRFGLDAIACMKCYLRAYSKHKRDDKK